MKQDIRSLLFEPDPKLDAILARYRQPRRGYLGFLVCLAVLVGLYGWMWMR